MATLLQENRERRGQLSTAERNAAEAKPQRAELDALRARLEAAGAAMRTTLATLSPAGQLAARRRLRDAGFTEWLDTS